MTRYQPEIGDTVLIEVVSGSKHTIFVEELKKNVQGSIDILGTSEGKPTIIPAGVVTMIRIVKPHK